MSVSPLEKWGPSRCSLASGYNHHVKVGRISTKLNFLIEKLGPGTKSKVQVQRQSLGPKHFTKFGSGIGIRNWNSELEFGIGIRNRNSESEFGIGIRNRNRNKSSRWSPQSESSSRSPQVGVLNSESSSRSPQVGAESSLNTRYSKELEWIEENN